MGKLVTPNSSGGSGVNGPRNDNLQLVGNLCAKVCMKTGGASFSEPVGRGVEVFLGRVGIAAVVLAAGLAIRAIIPGQVGEK